MSLDPIELTELAYAKRLLEHPGLAARLTAALGTPIEKSMTLLPAPWSASLQQSVHGALAQALRLALSTLAERPGADPSNRLHRLAVTASGAVGGAFGAAGLAVELPVSTTLMLRSIAAIARSEGEPLVDPESRLACLQVFALGGSSPADDAGETGYYAVRIALSRLLSDAAEHLARHGLAAEGAPVLLRLLGAIGARFGVVVGEKAAAQALPLVGAAGGALVNNLFIGHFQDAARGHFIVRRLERRHGEAAVRAAYRSVY